jgi:flagella basal body P-ring formation protein FlgA
MILRTIGVALAAVLVAATAAGRAEEPCDVTLRAAADSRGLTVRLGDVASISGGTAERRALLAEIDLAPAAGPGIAQSLPLETVRTVLRTAGFEAEASRLSGPPEALVETQARSYFPSDLAEAVRAFVESGIDREPGVDVAVEPPDLSAPVVVPLGRQGNEVAFEWSGAPRDRGTVTISADFRVDGRRVMRVPIRVAVRAFADALVVKTRLRRGDAVVPGAFERRRIEVTEVREPLVRDPGELPPLRAARDLQPGKPLVRADLYLPPAVRRGDTVRLVARRGVLTVSILVIVQKDGVVGDVVPVKNVDSQRLVLARVVGPGQIVAEESPAALPEEVH